MAGLTDRPVCAAVEIALRARFQLQHIEVLNESHKHNVAPGSESHFRVTLVSPDFAGQSLLQRQRAVNEVLAELLAGPIHALALHTYAPAEWDDRSGSPESPACLGGKQI